MTNEYQLISCLMRWTCDLWLCCRSSSVTSWDDANVSVNTILWSRVGFAISSIDSLLSSVLIGRQPVFCLVRWTVFYGFIVGLANVSMASYLKRSQCITQHCLWISISFSNIAVLEALSYSNIEDDGMVILIFTEIQYVTRISAASLSIFTIKTSIDISMF